MIDINKLTVRDLIEAGVHYGHLSKYYNPTNDDFILCTYSKFSIFNLVKSLEYLKIAVNFIVKNINEGKVVLFVGTKRSAKQVVEEFAEKCGMPYVNYRWLGGMLTNYQTIKQSMKRFLRLQTICSDGTLMRLTKKESLGILKETERLNLYFCGLKNMKKLPDVLFVIDVGKESVAVKEANKLGIPVVGIVDSNNTTDGINYIIPGNDDSIKVIRFYFNLLLTAVFLK